MGGEREPADDVSARPAMVAATGEAGCHTPAFSPRRPPTSPSTSFAAHLSQNDPRSPFQSQAMQDQMFEAAFGTECYVLARGALGEPRPERSLFAGVE